MAVVAGALVVAGGLGAALFVGREPLPPSEVGSDSLAQSDGTAVLGGAPQKVSAAGDDTQQEPPRADDGVRDRDPADADLDARRAPSERRAQSQSAETDQETPRKRATSNARQEHEELPSALRADVELARKAIAGRDWAEALAIGRRLVRTSEGKRAGYGILFVAHCGERRLADVMKVAPKLRDQSRSEKRRLLTTCRRLFPDYDGAL